MPFPRPGLQAWGMVPVGSLPRVLCGSGDVPKYKQPPLAPSDSQERPCRCCPRKEGLRVAAPNSVIIYQKNRVTCRLKHPSRGYLQVKQFHKKSVYASINSGRRVPVLCTGQHMLRMLFVGLRTHSSSLRDTGLLMAEQLHPWGALGL